MNFSSILIGLIINVLVSWLGGLGDKAFGGNSGANIFILVVMLITAVFSGYMTAVKAPKMSFFSVLIMGFCSFLCIKESYELGIWINWLFLIMVIPMTITGWMIFDLRKKEDEQESDQNIDWVYMKEPKGYNVKDIIKAIVAVVFFILGIILTIGNSLNVYDFSGCEVLSYISGRVLAPFLITVIIYKLLKKRKKSCLFPAITFFIIVLLTAVGSAQEWKTSDLEAFTNYQKSFIQELLVTKELSHKTFDEENYGKAAMVLEIHNDYMINARNIMKKMLQEIEEQNLNSDEILLKKVLTNKKKIEEYNAKYDNVFRIIDKAESDLIQNNNKLEEELAQCKVPSKIKKGLFLDCPPQNIVNLRKIFLAQQKVFQYVVNNKDKYTFKDNVITFYEQKNLDKYNSLIDEYNNAIDENTALEEVLLKKAKEMIE